MRLRVEHTTRYEYDGPVSYALQQLKLTPKERPGQQLIHNWTIDIAGGTNQLHYTDHHGNGVDLVAVDTGARELVIHRTGEVELITWDGVIGVHRGAMPLWTFLRPTPLTRAGRHVRALAAELRRDFASDIERAHALSALILEKLSYQIGVTDAETTAEQALGGTGGVCQDHAHIFISAMRHLGHPARYVSGYLMMNDRTQQDAAGSASTCRTAIRPTSAISASRRGSTITTRRRCAACVMGQRRKIWLSNCRCSNKR